MTEITKNFEHNIIEQKWIDHWHNQNYFSSKPDNREPYTIVMPPPNVTGVLHMGHSLNNTIQDILIRRARMQGKNACWVPGTDHASIATETKVVEMLREKGITKAMISREEFLTHAWNWKEKYGGIILQQLKKLGCSLDWKRTTFTLDEHYYKSVIQIFIQLYNEGIIYRKKRMINWDPVGKTALSDEEVIYKETESKLFYIKYECVDEPGFITVATTRPETIFGDVAICINPNDSRYKKMIGKSVLVPIINRKIKIISDEYVDPLFGTGALKITPAHDKNDYEIGQKHNLKIIDTLDASAKFTTIDLFENEVSEIIKKFIGLDRFILRKKILHELEICKALEKTEPYNSQIGTSERSGAVIENRLSLQWFVDMKKFMHQNQQVLNAVVNDEIKFYPSKLKNTYNHWIENIKDWCISRQLWWGHQIPAWYDESGNYVVAENLIEANKIFELKFGHKPILSENFTALKQDEDCLDTWFSSWLWPIEVFNGISQPGNDEFNYYYSTNTLVTGQDIIFFWVARMIMAGFAFEQKPPFKNVYFTGMVRDELSRKMSKQLGNSPDLLGLIEKYGADAVRFGVLIASPAGNDLLFDVKEESTLKQGSFFINKIWNALKLIHSWKERTISSSNTEVNFSVDWFFNRLQQAKTEIENNFNEYKLSEALKLIYTLIWDDFCSWYLEWIKPAIDESITQYVYNKTISFFDELLQLLHPYMPFVTEEIFHLLMPRSEDLTIKPLTASFQVDQEILKTGSFLKLIITTLRDVRNKNKLKPKENIIIYIETKNEKKFLPLFSLLKKQLNATDINFTQTSVIESVKTVVENDTFYLKFNQEINEVSQINDLQKELEYQQNFLASVNLKLNNEKFIQFAKPDVLLKEKQKQQDTLERIKTLQFALQQLN